MAESEDGPANNRASHADRIRRVAVDDEGARAEALFNRRKGTARHKAAVMMIDKVKAIHYELSTESEEEIELAAMMVQWAEEMTKKARDFDFIKDAIKEAEALTTRARRELDIKRTMWEANEDLMKVMIATLKSERLDLP